MRRQLIQSSPVLDQRLDQIDQQGEEATGSCGLWIEREEGEAQLTRVGGERGSEQPLTAPVVELTWDDVGRRMADAIAAAVYGPRGELRKRAGEG